MPKSKKVPIRKSAKNAATMREQTAMSPRERCNYSAIVDRPPLKLPGGARLVLWPIVGRGVAGYGAVSSGWALAILGIGTAVAVAAAIIYLATGNEPWLWAAAPGCLGSSFLLFAIARMRKQLATP